MKPTRNFFLTLTRPEVAITSDDLFPFFFLDPHLNTPGRYKTGHDVIALRGKKRKGGLELAATQFILPP